MQGSGVKSKVERSRSTIIKTTIQKWRDQRFRGNSYQDQIRCRDCIINFMSTSLNWLDISWYLFLKFSLKLEIPAQCTLFIFLSRKFSDFHCWYLHYDSGLKAQTKWHVETARIHDDQKGKAKDQLFETVLCLALDKIRALINQQHKLYAKAQFAPSTSTVP